MWEWAKAHPWMTFFLADSAIGGIVKVICTVVNRNKPTVIVRKEEAEHELSGDRN